MNFSAEEIFATFGQYDTFVILEFQYNSDEYNRFGNKLMGVFLYTIEERKMYEEALLSEQIPRTDTKIKFNPSSIEKLSAENLELLDRFGIQAGSIIVISSFNGQRKNRFEEKGKKEIPNQISIQVPQIDGWQELNRLRFGFLNSIYKSEKPFTPYQEIEYWGLRTHLGLGMDLEDFSNIKNRNADFLKKVRYVELDCKIQELCIEEEEIQEFVKLKVENILYKKDVIDKEIQKSGENINLVTEKFKTQIEELRKCCYPFEEDVIGFGKIPIYLSFERFVHIYARHVSETQIGERFSGEKTVFQYKFDDIKYLLNMVVKTVSDEIQSHFEQNPELKFSRIGKRAVYVDGHYYRLVIESNGSIQDFHPYNKNEE